MTLSERLAEYKEIASEVFVELGISERCSCEAGEHQMHHRWFVNIVCDGVPFSASGDEDPNDPYSRNIIKAKITEVTQKYLSGGG